MISDGEWTSIRTLIERVIVQQIGTRNDYFVSGKVIKRDEKNKLVWLAEFGDQAIPLLYFDSQVFVYDESPRGTKVPALNSNSPYMTYKKKLKIETLVPQIGDIVLVAREFGINRAPRCLGVFQSKNWADTEE